MTANSSRSSASPPGPAEAPAADAMGQQALTRAIPRRPRVGLGLGILLALGFALLVTPAIAFEAYLVQRGKLEVSPTATPAATVRTMFG